MDDWFEMADRERILNDDAKYLLRRETNMLQNIIDTKYNKLSESVQTQLVTVRTNTAGEKQIMAEEDNGLSLINVLQRRRPEGVHPDQTAAEPTSVRRVEQMVVINFRRCTLVLLALASCHRLLGRLEQHLVHA